MRTALVLAVLASCRLGVLWAQDASPYVPLSHWGMPYVEHLIARGAMVDPTPLTRPFKQADLLRALAGADSASLTAGERRVVAALRADLERREHGPWGRVDGHLGVAAATHARRDPLREQGGGAGHATVAGGLGVQLLFGPIAVVTHPYFDSRLKYDADYQGKKDRAVGGRSAEAYLSGQWRYGELFFGALDRNWGPPATEGLLVSPSPYSYAHFGLSVGTAGIRLEGLLTQLDDLPDTTGAPNHRYFVAHRLIVHPPGRTTAALWEGVVLAGPGRELEPWYANIATLGLLEEYSGSPVSNSLVGLDLTTRVGRAKVFASVLLDDIQVDRSSPLDREPASYGVTLGAQGGVRTAAWTAFYTRVANLTYRSPNPVETVMFRGVGLARNFSDYDQLTLRTSFVAGPGILVAPEATLLRQGQGDFRLPYPPVSAYPTTPGFLAGVVERTVRLAVAARYDRASWGLAGDGGVHLISNVGHVSERRDTRLVGSIALVYRFKRESLLP